MKAHFLILNDLFMTALSGQFFCLKKNLQKFFSRFSAIFRQMKKIRKNFRKIFRITPLFWKAVRILLT